MVCEAVLVARAAWKRADQDALLKNIWVVDEEGMEDRIGIRGERGVGVYLHGLAVQSHRFGGIMRTYWKAAAEGVVALEQAVGPLPSHRKPGDSFQGSTRWRRPRRKVDCLDLQGGLCTRRPEASENSKRLKQFPRRC